MCKLCIDIALQLPPAVVKQLDVLHNSMAQKIYTGELTGAGMHTATSLYTFKQMRAGLYEAAGGDFSTFRVDTPMYTRMAQAELDLLQFACFKNNWLAAEGEFLKSAAGNKAEFEALFRNSFNRSYLTQWDVELQHSRNVGEAIKRWSDVEHFTGEGFDWLEYHTMQDERVRDDHRPWDNIKLPVTHQFWRTHYPPNGYGCRCYVSNDFEGPEVEPLPGDIEKYPVAPEFAKNFGESGRPFSGPQSHKYLAEMDATDKRPLFVSANKLKDHLEAYYDATPPDYKGRVLAHPLLSDNELAQNLLQAGRIAKNSKVNVKLHPAIGDIKAYRNPDASVGGVISEFKAPQQVDLVKSIMGEVREAGLQGAVVAYIYINAGFYNREQIIRALARLGGQPESPKSVKEVVIQVEGLDKDIRVPRNKVKGFDFSDLP